MSQSVHERLNLTVKCAFRHTNGGGGKQMKTLFKNEDGEEMNIIIEDSLIKERIPGFIYKKENELSPKEKNRVYPNRRIQMFLQAFDYSESCLKIIKDQEMEDILNANDSEGSKTFLLLFQIFVFYFFTFFIDFEEISEDDDEEFIIPQAIDNNTNDNTFEHSAMEVVNEVDNTLISNTNINTNQNETIQNVSNNTPIIESISSTNINSSENQTIENQNEKSNPTNLLNISNSTSDSSEFVDLNSTSSKIEEDELQTSQIDQNVLEIDWDEYAPDVNFNADFDDEDENSEIVKQTSIQPQTANNVTSPPIHSNALLGVPSPFENLIPQRSPPTALLSTPNISASNSFPSSTIFSENTTIGLHYVPLDEHPKKKETIVCRKTWKKANTDILQTLLQKFNSKFANNLLCFQYTSNPDDLVNSLKQWYQNNFSLTFCSTAIILHHEDHFSTFLGFMSLGKCYFFHFDTGANRASHNISDFKIPFFFNELPAPTENNTIVSGYSSFAAAKAVYLFFFVNDFSRKNFNSIIFQQTIFDFNETFEIVDKQIQKAHSDIENEKKAKKGSQN